MATHWALQGKCLGQLVKLVTCISQRADKGSVHNLRAAQQQRGGQAGAAATVLGQPAGQSCCLSD